MAEKKERLINFTVQVPESLHRVIKSHVAKEGTTMRALIDKLIREYFATQKENRQEVTSLTGSEPSHDRGSCHDQAKT